MTRKRLTERIDLPEDMVRMIELRTNDLVRACMWEPNIIKSIALSCYQQGAMDTMQLIQQRPGFVSEWLAVAGGGTPNDELPID